LARIPEKYGVDNVYAELGSVFAVTSVSAPRYCAGILGTLIKAEKGSGLTNGEMSELA
jgi:hypothetical protein